MNTSSLETGAVAQGARTLRILLAEDNAINQDLAVRRLSRRGYDVVVAGNGCAALDLLERERFDLVLMDVQMPLMDGLTTAAAVRAREKMTGGHMPIIALTAMDSADDSANCVAAGMDGHTVKPIDWPKLFRLIETTVTGLPAAAALDPGPTTQVVLDRAALNATFGEDLDLLRAMSRVFLEERPGRLEDIRLALAAANAPRVQRLCHALRGALGTMAAPIAMRAAADLEGIARHGNLDRAEPAFDVLVSEVGRFAAALLEL